MPIRQYRCPFRSWLTASRWIHAVIVIWQCWIMNSICFVHSQQASRPTSGTARTATAAKPQQQQTTTEEEDIAHQQQQYLFLTPPPADMRDWDDSAFEYPTSIRSFMDGDGSAAMNHPANADWITAAEKLRQRVQDLLGDTMKSSSGSSTSSNSKVITTAPPLPLERLKAAMALVEDPVEREKLVLFSVFRTIRGTKSMKMDGLWLDELATASSPADLTSYCSWMGITCAKNEKNQGDENTVLDDDSDDDDHDDVDNVEQAHGGKKKKVPTTSNKGRTAAAAAAQSIPREAVTRIELPFARLNGSLPLELILLRHLKVIHLEGNRLHGTIPPQFALLTQLQSLDLHRNSLEGTFPVELTWHCPQLHRLILGRNVLRGRLPANRISSWSDRLTYFDVSSNCFRGSIPEDIIQLTVLRYLAMGDNRLTGTLPNDWTSLSRLRLLDLGSNVFHGTVPRKLPGSLLDLNVADNILTGTFPVSLLSLSNLHTLLVADNELSGILPAGDDLVPGEPQPDRPLSGYEWSHMRRLGTLIVSGNRLAGTIPQELYIGLSQQLYRLDISRNQFSGTISTVLGLMKGLHEIDAESNRLSGQIPDEMLDMNPNLRLNFTDNLITGTIPRLFCGQGAASVNMLYREFGCDAVLCRPGTFNIHGHATLHSACRVCPTVKPEEDRVWGRIECDGMAYVHGDLNGDGILSPREILRIIYVDTLGRFWGSDYQTWADIKRDECELEGITCSHGVITKIDLSAASMCSNGNRKPGPVQYCKGLPAEIGQLSKLEVSLNLQKFLRGTIPTEIGNLTRLTHLDFTSCAALTGTLPSELGNLRMLKSFILAHTRVRGTIPPELFDAVGLEKLHLTNNLLGRRIPTQIGRIRRVKEIMMSRNYLTGTIPTEFGKLLELENVELYHNRLVGTIPSEFGDCINLKRIDMFNNKLAGPVPPALASIQDLQIVHLKGNLLTSTIPSEFGHLQFLTWLDWSDNDVHGTIPSSFATSPSLRDFRLANNMIHGPIPPGLCTNPKIHGGATVQFGCDGILCPVGTYSENGHAADNDPCEPCPDGKTTVYMGSTLCVNLTESDILAILYEVMNGDSWPEEMRENWGDPSKSACQWAGIECDESGSVVSLALPLMEY